MNQIFYVYIAIITLYWNCIHCTVYFYTGVLRTVKFRRLHVTSCTVSTISFCLFYNGAKLSGVSFCRVFLKRLIYQTNCVSNVHFIFILILGLGFLLCH